MNLLLNSASCRPEAVCKSQVLEPPFFDLKLKTHYRFMQRIDIKSEINICFLIFYKDRRNKGAEKICQRGGGGGVPQGYVIMFESFYSFNLLLSL